MRIVFVTQAADPAHPVLGATLAKIRALSERCDEVVVLADSIDEAALPANCRGRSFAAPSQLARGARYVAALGQELLDRPVAVVAHMAPVYALLAAPLTKPLRVPASSARRSPDAPRGASRSHRRRSARSAMESTSPRSRACPSGVHRFGAYWGSAATRRSRAGKRSSGRSTSSRKRR